VFLQLSAMPSSWRGRGRAARSRNRTQVTLLCAPVVAGLAVALAASLRVAGPAGALAGLVLLLAGLVAGYLAAGAVQLRALTGATTVPAAHAALATAAGRWTLTAAALAGAVALALACIGRRRTGARPGPGRNRDPE
jgi:hypothetical protein